MPQHRRGRCDRAEYSVVPGIRRAIVTSSRGDRRTSAPRSPDSSDMSPTALVPMVSALLVAAHAGTATAQLTAGSVLDRTPNLVNTWLADPATVQFNFLHRFTESGPPEHQISNSPTFLVAAGLPWRTTAGFAYATTSDGVSGRPNAWGYFGRGRAFGPGGPVGDMALKVGHNVRAART